MTASRYLLSAKYFSPLSKYFCLRTLGSREQPVNRAAMTQQESNSRMVIERRIGGFSDGGRRKRAKVRRLCTNYDTASTTLETVTGVIRATRRIVSKFRLNAECNLVVSAPHRRGRA